MRCKHSSVTGLRAENTDSQKREGQCVEQNLCRVACVSTSTPPLVPHLPLTPQLCHQSQSRKHRQPATGGSMRGAKPAPSSLYLNIHNPPFSALLTPQFTGFRAVNTDSRQREGQCVEQGLHLFPSTSKLRWKGAISMHVAMQSDFENTRGGGQNPRINEPLSVWENQDYCLAQSHLECPRNINSFLGVKVQRYSILYKGSS